MIAWAGFIVQPVANDYLRRRYADARPLAMTSGEIVAAIIGVLFFVAEMVFTFVWT